MNLDVQQSAWRNRIVGHGDEAPGQLLANPRNWRLHPKHQQDALSGILGEVGWVQEITVNRRTGFVVDGHLRVALAVSRRERFVPVRYVDLDEDEEALVLATLDPIGAMASSDAEQLSALLEGLEPADEAVAKLLRELAPPRTKQLNPDDADLTPPEEPVTQPGDLWLLGDHRLLCGDAFIQADHDRVLEGRSVDLVLTDPPYGVGIRYDQSPDDQALVQRVIGEALPLMRRWQTVLITTGHRWLWHYPEPTWLLGWVHPAGMGIGPWGFNNLHPVVAYGKDPYLSHGLGSRPDALVLAADREGVEGHPTPKPLDVWKWLVERGTVAEDNLVFDPFLGSGTSVIAAEELSRICYGLEISPAYCDVIVRRWERVSGRQAEKANA